MPTSPQKISPWFFSIISSNLLTYRWQSFRFRALYLVTWSSENLAPRNFLSMRLVLFSLSTRSMSFRACSRRFSSASFSCSHLHIQATFMVMVVSCPSGVACCSAFRYYKTEEE